MGDKHTISDLYQMQSLPLLSKIRMTEYRISQWIDEYGEDGVYVSFSGGKDSTVLLDIVRNRMGYTNVPAVFVDTGLEYPEIREFVKTFDNVVWLRPKKTFKQVIEEYGYPFISKEVSERVFYARKYLNNYLEKNEDYTGFWGLADFIGVDRRNVKDNKEYDDLKKGIISQEKIDEIFAMDGKAPARAKALYGTLEHKEKGVPTSEKSNMFDSSKYKFLLLAPFPVHNACCNVMKKAPVHAYTKQTGRKPMTGQQASESRLRTSQWLKNGCNGFKMKNPISNPMSFWTEQDILAYIKEFNIPICSVYGEVVNADFDEFEQVEGQLNVYDLGLFEPDRQLYKTTGCSRTGCMFCGYGCHLEQPGKGRFELMKKTHPKQYDYIMRPLEQGGLNYKEIIDWINENGKLNIKY